MLILFLLQKAWAQPQLIAEASRYRVELGDVIEVTYTVNERVNNFENPNFGSDFDLLSGPNRGFQTQIINGRVSQEQSFGFLIRPKKIGRLKISPARAEYKGDYLESKALEIEVVAKGSRTPSQSNNQDANEVAFMRIEPTKRSVYVGEPLVVEYSVYYSESIEAPNIEERPDFKGFQMQILDVPDAERSRREVINGINYQRTVHTRMLLIPQIPAAKVSGNLSGSLPTYMRTGRRDIFNRPQVVLVPQSFSLKVPNIEVKALPENGKPEGFEGAVGDFEMLVDLSENEVDADGSVTLKIAISGQGNLSFINLPKPELPSQIEVFDPQIRNDFRTGTYGQKGIKTNEYLLIPRYKGVYKIPPFRFVYFNTKTQQYKTLESDALELRVLSGQESNLASAGNGPSSPTEKQSVEALGNDIRFLDLRPQKWTNRQSNREAFVRLMLVLMPWILLSIWLVFRAYSKNRLTKGYQITRARAFQTAYKAIEKLHALPKDQIYTGLHKSLETFLMQRFGLNRADLNASKVSEVLQAHGLNMQLVQLFLSLLQTIESGHYAPMAVEANALRLQMLEVLKQLEEAL